MATAAPEVTQRQRAAARLGASTIERGKHHQGAGEQDRPAQDADQRVDDRPEADELEHDRHDDDQAERDDHGDDHAEREGQRHEIQPDEPALLLLFVDDVEALDQRLRALGAL